ncbi:MAG: AHH domain-containing protein [Bacteroidetes bacterium]|nr:AHH domain-containing protein [Bacteroidota bacterium]
MDKTAADSVAQWSQELIDGKTEITGKVDDVLEENRGMVTDAKDAIDSEAEQLASEWEATYWARQILSVIGDIILLVVEIVLTIIAIVIAIVLLVLAIIALVLLIVVLIDLIVAAIAYLVGLLIDLVAEALVAILGDSVAELGVGWAMRLFLQNAFRSAWMAVAGVISEHFAALMVVLANAAPFFDAVIIADIIYGAGEWVYSFAPWLTDEQKKQLRVDGSIKVVTGVLFKWFEILRFLKGEKPPISLTPEMQQLEDQMAKDAAKKKAGQKTTDVAEKEAVEIVKRNKAFRVNVFLEMEKVGIKIPEKFQSLFQCHHVIEFNFANDATFGPFLRKIGFDIESAAQNGIPLLSKPYANVLKENPGILTEFPEIKIWEKLPQHLGPHPESYNNLIQTKLQVIYDAFLIDKNSDKALTKVNNLVDEIIGKFDSGELKLRKK